ncbi:MAG: sirohydrochlorin cobaltochelatase [Desulfovibrio sp.]|uniref:sirohydrochlorin cobaltochelatase n=1 Tax=Desulfovibrio sp. 7SRBS1 TaxID=3378064 RepID=UPI003B3D08FB
MPQVPHKPRKKAAPKEHSAHDAASGTCCHGHAHDHNHDHEEHHHGHQHHHNGNAPDHHDHDAHRDHHDHIEHDDHHGHDDHDNQHNEHCHHSHHHHHGGVPKPRTGKHGILLSAFGCALPHTHKYYDLFEEEVRAAYPDMDVRWAFTANRIRAKLRARGMEHLSVAEALSQMVDDGFSHVAVQSVHTVPGVEYEWTVQQAKAMVHPRKGLTKVTIGAPLMQTMADMERTAQIIMHSLLPKTEANDGIILVGHGTYHQGHAFYLALENLLMRTAPNIAMGTLMDRNGPAEIGQRFLDKGVQRVFLVPFMCLPGHHVQVDMFGDKAQAWKQVLSSMGLEVMPVTTGSLEHKAFRDIWHDHLAKAVAALQKG